MTTATVTERQLWDRMQGGDRAARDLLYCRHLGLVRAAATAIARWNPHVSTDELVGAGAIGLGEALDRFRPERGFQFSTLALRRIRGAMFDWIRAQTPHGRSLHTWGQRLQAAERAIEQEQGEPAPAGKVAAELELTPGRYWKIRDTLARTKVSLEDYHTATAETELPLDAVIRAETRDRVQAAIGCLPQRWREIVTLYYYEDLDLMAVGARYGVTASRVSQILKAARDALAAQLEPEYAELTG